MARIPRDLSHLARRPSSTLLPFLYETRTIQRRPLHASSSQRAEDPAPETPSNNETPSLIRKFNFPRGGLTKHQIHQAGQRPPSERRHRRRNSFQPREASADRDVRRSPRDFPDSTLERIYRSVDDELPFEGLSSQARSTRPPPHSDAYSDESNTPRRTRDSTITELERTAFARLFDKLSGRATSTSDSSTTTPNPPSPSPEDLDTLLSETSTDLSDSDYLDLDRILDDDLRTPLPSDPLSAYPTALRPMAARAHAKLRRRDAQSTSPTSPSAPASAEAQSVAAAMKSARTDADLYRILETEVLAKVRALDLDSPSALAARDPASNPTLSTTYSALLLLALRLLIRRTAYTPLAFALLPAAQALGPSAHALLASAGFYNELLVYTWNRTSSLAAVNGLLRDMDAAGLGMGRRTYGALGRIAKYRERAGEGLFGEGCRAWEGMMGREAEARVLEGWMGKCWRAIQEEATDGARRRRWEEEMRAEELASGEEEGVVGNRV